MGDRSYNTCIYLLFLILVIGVFAAIAQNDYGAFVIAGSCFSFSFVFILRLFELKMTKDNPIPRTYLKTEYLIFAAVMCLFGLRALRIRFEFVEELFVGLTGMMFLLYLYYLLLFSKTYKGNKDLFAGSGLMHGSIALFFLSMSLSFINFNLSTLLGAISFGMMCFYFIWYVWKNPQTNYKYENTLIYSELYKFENLAPVFTTILFLSSLYMGLFKIGAIPAIYTGELPVKYVELEEKYMRSELPDTDSIPQYKLYWREYETFLKNMDQRPKE